MHSRWALMVLAVSFMACPISAFAYRPFDSTDAAVADLHATEIELSPVSYEHNDSGALLTSPSARLNYGFADAWEVVLEGQLDYFLHGRSQLSEAALSVKSVLTEGSLQDKSGVSFATEASILLPGIGTDDGAGFELTGVASQRWEWGTVHLNVAAMLTREQRASYFLGAIFEGPSDWPVRPVAELNYQREFGVGEEYSALIGAIWQVKENLALDLAYRHAGVSSRSDEQLRAGVTFDL